MTKGDIIELKIDGVGKDGEGVGRIDGIVIFVPMALIGETVRVKIGEVKKNFAFAQVIKVLDPSPMRRVPVCPVFYKCGGCNMMHINYQQQLEIKRINVETCMRKVAKTDAEVLPVLSVGSEYGYRNKVQLPVALQNGRVVVGYYKEKTHTVIPFDKCYLHGEWADSVIKIFLEWANRYKVTVYDERVHRGLLRHLIVRKLGDSISVTVVINGDSLPSKDRLTAAIKELGYRFNLCININKARTNVIMSDETICIYGQSELMHRVGNVQVAVSPNSFMQINDSVANAIYSEVADRIFDMGAPLVLECYSGIGVMTNIIANSGIDVVSCEIVPAATDNANTMAKLNNNIDRIVNICGDAAVVMPAVSKVCRDGELSDISRLDISAEDSVRLNEMLSRHRGDNIVAVLDPPRKGCDEAVLQAVMGANPESIFYISCSPSTLARDVAVLSGQYSVCLIQPYDMFPNTGHVETLVCLTRIKDSSKR